jgi:hypothetical protein
MCLITPSYQVIAQETSNTDQQVTIQTDDNDDSGSSKTDKKKKKDKDVIDLTEKFFYCFLINLATFLIITVFVYYPNNRHLERIFAFLMFNIVIFMLTFVLNKIKISMGAAFGLFAVFSMLRYRTEGISMKDMTYLFIFIAIGLISAIQLEYYELAIINGIITLFTFLFDSNLIIKREQSKEIKYENIELVHPDKREQLIDDIKKRTGLNIHRLEIEEINFLRDTANIKIYYYEKK